MSTLELTLTPHLHSFVEMVGVHNAPDHTVSLPEKLPSLPGHGGDAFQTHFDAIFMGFMATATLLVVLFTLLMWLFFWMR